MKQPITPIELLGIFAIVALVVFIGFQLVGGVTVTVHH